MYDISWMHSIFVTVDLSARINLWPAELTLFIFYISCVQRKPLILSLNTEIHTMCVYLRDSTLSVPLTAVDVKMGSEANVESQTASGQCLREMCLLQQEARCAARSKTVRHEKLHFASSLLSKKAVYRRVNSFHAGHSAVYIYIYIYLNYEVLSSHA